MWILPKVILFCVFVFDPERSPLHVKYYTNLNGYLSSDLFWTTADYWKATHSLYFLNSRKYYLYWTAISWNEVTSILSSYWAGKSILSPTGQQKNRLVSYWSTNQIAFMTLIGRYWPQPKPCRSGWVLLRGLRSSHSHCGHIFRQANKRRLSDERTKFVLFFFPI